MIIDKTENLLMTSLRFRFMRMNSYCVFCCVASFVYERNVTSKIIDCSLLTTRKLFVDSDSISRDVFVCIIDLLFQMIFNRFFSRVLTTHWKFHVECFFSQLTHFLWSFIALHSSKKCSYAQKSHLTSLRQALLTWSYF
jgi:hypothetical protein